jgi:Ca2+-binding RTX toxin-like protein/V8-like Glu-specific endopeptidase
LGGTRVLSTSTTIYPEDTIVRITDVIGGETYQGSGVLISPDEVLTASHMLYQYGVGTASGIEVSAGYSAGSTPFGTVAGVSFHYNAVNDSGDAISNAASQSDYAVIHLAQPITNVGTMTIGVNYAGGAATVSGYPASANGAQVDDAETLFQDPYYTLLEGTALGPGSSGGPVWINGANGQAEIVGLVSSGSGRRGYFVQITNAAATQIEAWVAADDGSSGTNPVTSGVTQVTVTGPAGASVTANFPAATATLAAQILAQISEAITAGSLVAETATQGAALPVVPVGASGALFVSQAQAVTVTSAYSAVVDTASGSSTLSLASGANVSVVASGGALTLAAGSTSGTLVGGSNGTVFSEQAGHETWNIALGGGANTVAAMGGSSTISAGAGQNLILLGSGASSVASSGTDTIVGGSGAATISAAANRVLAFGGSGALTFIAGSSSSTVVGGTGGTTLQGGGGGTLLFATGASSYMGGGAADTVLGGTGSLVANGGGGAVLIFGGSAGANQLTSGAGAATMVGGGNSDLLIATGSANNMLVAGSGAETLTAAGSSGVDLFFGGTGADVITGGTGTDFIVPGAGNETLNAGSAVNAFIFINGIGSGTDVITGFSAQNDDVYLEGFGGNAISAALRSQTTSASGVQITLPDGLHILFTGVNSLTASSFYS